jgi:hypothetical protein
VARLVHGRDRRPRRLQRPTGSRASDLRCGNGSAATISRLSFINAVGESDKADERLRSLAIAHKKVVLERIATLCDEAGCRDRRRWRTRSPHHRQRHRRGALITRDTGVADTAGHACRAIVSGARD